MFCALCPRWCPPWLFPCSFLRESLSELGASSQQPTCVPALCVVPAFLKTGGASQRTQKCRASFCFWVGGLSKKQMTRSLRTSLECTEPGAGLLRLGGPGQVSQKRWKKSPCWDPTSKHLHTAHSGHSEQTDIHSIAECHSNGGGTDNFGTLVLPWLPDEEATDNSGSRKGKEGVSSALVTSLRS